MQARSRPRFLRTELVNVIARQALHFGDLAGKLLQPLHPSCRSAEGLKILHNRQFHVNFRRVARARSCDSFLEAVVEPGRIEDRGVEPESSQTGVGCQCQFVDHLVAAPPNEFDRHFLGFGPTFPFRDPIKPFLKRACLSV